MKIVVTGADGQLGWELCRRVGADAIRLPRADMDLIRPHDVSARLASVRPDVVVNCAAYTKVDQAETEPELCHTINADAVRAMAHYCQENGIGFVQISTDYVFDGSGRPDGYDEDDEVQPNSVYAQSKHRGELLASACERHVVVRTCGLYGHAPGRTNFVTTILRLARERGHLSVVNDQRCTPTYIPHLADAIRFLIETDARGLYHVVNRDCCTWLEFAAEIIRLSGLEQQTKLSAISTKDFGALAPRPADSVLNTDKYHSLGGPSMPTWRDALAEYFRVERSKAGDEP